VCLMTKLANFQDMGFQKRAWGKVYNTKLFKLFTW
jgi:hypothetical protein